MDNLDLHLNIFFLIGISLLGGLFGAKIFRKIKIPQVLGYIIAGILIGKSGFKLISSNYIEIFKTFNFFALGIIGFLVGGELYFNKLKKYARQFTSILCFEGLMAFFFTGALISSILFYLTNNLSISIAAGIVIGAISSATDPASTMSVLWEYRARGILTTTISAIIALDDVLAMTLYGISVGIATILVSSNSNIYKEILTVFYELGGSILLGFLMGIFSNFILKKSRLKDNTTSIIIGSLILIISLAQMFHFDIILATLSLGIFLVNFAPDRSKTIFKLVKDVSSPIYILFFVLVGSNIEIAGMPGWLWILVIIYVFGRNFGKVLGSNIGAILSHAPVNVRKYMGYGLFAQGGAAIGLAIMAGYHLQNIKILGTTLGNLVITCITATTFLIQIIGPIMVKMAVVWADEINRDITDEDIIKEHTCEDMMIKDIILFQENDQLEKVFKIISTSDQTLFPVVNKNNTIVGIINLALIRNFVFERDTWKWMLAGDLSIPCRDHINRNSKLEEGLNVLNQKNINQLIIFDNENSNVPVGILNKNKVHRSIHFEIIKKRDAKV